MRTVSTLCASGAGISLSAVGLTLARPDNDPPPTKRHPHMATATYTVSPVDTRTAPHRSFSTPLTGLEEHGRAYTSATAKTGQKRAFSLTPRESLSIGMDRQIQRNEDTPSQAVTPTARPRSWLRRFSSSMTTSRDSNRTPSSSRPGSAAVSQSNGSVAFSNTGSTTPIFSDTRPSALPRNKLVKRTSSLRSSSNGTPSPGSRLPLPVLKRPATSHQRSATIQETLSGTDLSDRMSIDQSSQDARDPPLRQYFTPRIAAEDVSYGRRRSSTGIPNPIKRVYPDRKYTPILVSAGEPVKPAHVEVDDGLSANGEDVAVTKLRLAPSVASSPLPVQTAHFEEASAPRRSFSIGDLLSTGPQPLWKRPTSSRGKATASKLARRVKPRVASAPQAPMGNSFSSTAGQDSERPAKRRDLTDPQTAQRSIYSSSSSTRPTDSPRTETQLGFGATPPLSQQVTLADSPIFETVSQVATPSPLEQRRLPSATAESTAARPARVSTSQSEITSTVGSDSERRSTGGYSTDYQSDTVYDSFPTRTTRSTSGKRGPPIDAIFDDSPPTYSSGRSTKLHDLLNDGTFPGSEQSRRYRHSTIEEEESVLSTPVRSMRDNSVTSTPSARPGAQQLFLSSPPAMSTMPDPDEIDWDAPEAAQPPNQGLGIQQHNAAPTTFPLEKGLAFRLGGAFARSVNTTSAHSTPSRYSNGGTDKANPFDWSEQQPSPSHQDQSPPRPRTVHGKKDPESRGSRPAGRRAPSGMHARSHSVPVVPDADGKRSVVANKFGTWGVGSKGVTEDWNEDFDFEEAPQPLPERFGQDEKRIDSGHEMFVPKSIREQQENVVANISLLREWGLLIEELKDLRMRAVALDMLKGPYAPSWQEVDAMIELADQESEEETLAPRHSPPSSPGFDDSEFEEPPSTIDDVSRPRGASIIRLTEPTIIEDELVLSPARASPHQSTPIHAFTVRPRKDSEAVARSVIEALQSKRSVSDPTALKAAPATKKVPFDTATLRHIVPYVNLLKRRVKDALRETEGLYNSPRRRPPPTATEEDSDGDAMDVDEPAFRSIFNEPLPHDSPTASRRTRREMAATDNDGFDEPFEDGHIDLAQRMQNMALGRRA